MSRNEKFIGPAPKRQQEPYGPYLPKQKQPPEPLVLIAQPGEDFYKLARDYFLLPQQLRRANLHLCDPQALKGGEALVIPLAEADMMQMNSFLLKNTFNDAEARRRFGRLIPKSRVDARLFARCTPGGGSGSDGVLTVEQLAKIAPNLKRSKLGSAESVTTAVNAAIRYAEANTEQRIAAFLAQLMQESDGLNTAEEYASGAQYNKRTDLGNIPELKEGPRFKGRGFIQLTGRKNYTNCWQDLGWQLRRDASTANYYKGVDPTDPERAARDLDDAARVTGWYWRTNNINTLCDQLTSSKEGEEKAFYRISQAVNNPSGVPNHAAERLQYYRRAKRALGYTWGTVR